VGRAITGVDSVKIVRDDLKKLEVSLGDLGENRPVFAVPNALVVDKGSCLAFRRDEFDKGRVMSKIFERRRDMVRLQM